MIDEIRELYDYNAWANARILGAVGALSPEAFGRDLGSSFPSVGETLAHMLLAEWIWLARWRGTSPGGPPADWDLSRYDALRARWREVERDQHAFVGSLTEDDLGRGIAYTDMGGTHYVSPLWQMLRHVVNHSSYHRGQVVTLLRQLGADVVSTDLMRFYREREAQAVG